jgi:hypothetical protein
MAGTLKINWSFASRIDGGPQLSESQPVIEVMAYDYIKQTLLPPVAPATSTTGDVNLVVGANPQMIAILSNKYSDKVTYEVDGAAPDHVLDAPHLFLGVGAVAYMGSANPKKLTFTNKSTDTITVQVFVGRPA